MKLIIVLFTVLLSIGAQAQMEFGALVGFRSNQAQTDISLASVSSRTSYQFGVQGFFPIWNDLAGLRTGAMVAPRYVNLSNTRKGTVEINYIYLDVPATLMLKFNEVAGVFAGPILSFNYSKEVSCSLQADCVATDVKSVVVPWTLGLNFKILPQIGGELFYEYVPGDLSTNVSNMTTVGANFIFYIE